MIACSSSSTRSRRLSSSTTTIAHPNNHPPQVPPVPGDDGGGGAAGGATVRSVRDTTRTPPFSPRPHLPQLSGHEKPPGTSENLEKDQRPGGLDDQLETSHR
jgi:hypothetical protein